MAHFTIQIVGNTVDGADATKIATAITEKLEADGHQVKSCTVTNSGDDTKAKTE